VARERHPRKETLEHGNNCAAGISHGLINVRACCPPFIGNSEMKISITLIGQGGPLGATVATVDDDLGISLTDLVCSDENVGNWMLCPGDQIVVEKLQS
jgi:hypothetical protein